VKQRRSAAAQQELEEVKKRAAEQEAETKAKAAEVVSKANKYARSPLPDLTFSDARAYDHKRIIANGFSGTRKDGSVGNASKGNRGSALSTLLLPPSSESDDGKPGRSQSKKRKGGKKNDAEVDGAEEGHMSKETRLAKTMPGTGPCV
jgi:hypothetical protein